MNSNRTPPQLVQAAVTVMLVALAIGSLRVILTTSGIVTDPFRRSGGALPVMAALLALLLMVWLAERIYRGCGWARILVLVLTVLGSWAAFREARHELRYAVFLGGLGFLQGALQIVAVALMFAPSASAYFQTSKSSDDSQ
jgi:hypothetical protein